MELDKILDISDEELYSEHREFSYIEGMPKIHQEVTATVHEFSNFLIHVPEEESKTEYPEFKMNDHDNCYGVNQITVYANGLSKDSHGFVSVELYCKYFDIGCCIISVIDVNQEQRFSRTFSFFPDPFNVVCDIPSLVIDKYISRESLLADPDVLLPNDILTLKVDVHLVGDRFKSGEFVSRTKDIYDVSVQLDRSDSDNSVQLLLDSPLAKCLSENSTYFGRILDTPMRERDTKRMPLGEDEFETFERIGSILTGNEVHFYSVRDIFNLYIVADKYDIPAVSETCTCFLKLSLLNHTVDKLQHEANEYENEGWKELITKEINFLNESDFDEEVKKISMNSACLKSPVRGRLWLYTHDLGLGSILFQNVLKESRNSHEKKSFDFYR